MKTVKRIWMIMGVIATFILSAIGSCSLCGEELFGCGTFCEVIPPDLRIEIMRVSLIFSCFWAIFSLLIFCKSPLRVEHVSFPYPQHKGLSWPYKWFNRFGKKQEATDSENNPTD